MTRKIRPKAEQAKRLLTDLHALPTQPIGDHLSDEACSRYAAETMTAAEIELADQHLATCPECATRLEKLLDAFQGWEGEQGTQRLADLRAKMLTPATPSPDLLEELRAFFASFFYPLSPAPSLIAHAASETPPPLDFESEDRAWGIFVTEAKNGEVIVRLDASTFELEGREISVSAGNWERRAVLSKTPEGDALGVEVRLSVQEREALPPNAVLYIRLIGNE